MCRKGWVRMLYGNGRTELDSHGLLPYLHKHLKREKILSLWLDKEDLILNWIVVDPLRIEEYGL